MLKKILLIFLGAVSWSLVMVKSGWLYSFGLGFWGPNGHDGVWHVALAEGLARGSWEIPTFAGEIIKNYHLGFDLLLAFLHKITFIPVSTLYFQVLPPVFALAIGLLVYKFVFLWTKSEKASLFSTFFVYFGGSFGYLLGKGESAFWSQAAISTLINPPFAMSLIFILLGLIFLLKKKFILVILCFGILIQVKVYAGVLVLGGLLVATLFDKSILKVFVGSLVLSLILFLPFNSNPQGLLVFQPFWFLETMMGLSDRIGWAKFGEAMVNYKMGGVWLKGILAYSIAFAIFIAGNFGTRLVFLFRKTKLDAVNVFVYSIITAGVVVPMLFLQKGTPWNTIQFMYYSLFFSGILAGVVLSRANRYAGGASFAYLLIAVILLTIPTTIFTLKDVYLPGRPPAMLSNDELSALNFLKSQPDGVVLTYPFDRLEAKEAENFPPRPLYLYESTAYVSAYSGKRVFLEDEVNLDITGYPWRERRDEIEKWYKETNQEKAREFLAKNNIKFIYWLKGQKALLGETQLGLINIYENSQTAVYKVD